METKLSLIVPCYNEAEGLSALCAALAGPLEEIGQPCELIFVDDGSTDDTLAAIKALSPPVPRSQIRFVSFSRNFGKEAAILAGLRAARGDYVSLIDADLQDDPRLLVDMYRALEALGYDCAAARRASRAGEPRLRSWSARRFYWLMGRLSQVGAVDGERDFRMMRRQVVESILAMPERSRYSKGIFAWVGYKTLWLEEEYRPRDKGGSKWSFFRLCRYAIDALLSFSTAPLVLASYIGILFCLLSVAGILFTIVRQAVWGGSAYGWPSLVCILLLVSGVQLFCIGVLGQYVAKIYTETKGRPVYIVRESSEDG